MANISSVTLLDGNLYYFKDVAARGDITTLQNIVNAIGSGFNYLGSVSTFSSLPASANLGDLYTVSDEGNAEYAYDGTTWIKLDNLAISQVQIDNLF